MRTLRPVTEVVITEEMIERADLSASVRKPHVWALINAKTVEAETEKIIDQLDNLPDAELEETIIRFRPKA